MASHNKPPGIIDAYASPGVCVFTVLMAGWMEFVILYQHNSILLSAVVSACGTVPFIMDVRTKRAS